MTRKMGLLILLILLALALPLMAGAETGGTDGNITWTLDDDGVLTISGIGEMNDYSWKEVDDTYITTAPWGATATSVIICDGVTRIGHYAFEGCTGLTSITIPEGVTSIGWGTFWDCPSLTSITIPDGVTSIGSYAFDNCPGIRYAHIGSDGAKSLSKAGYYFREPRANCNLIYLYTHDEITGLEIRNVDKDISTFTIPDGVTSIGTYAFRDCTSLNSITIPDSVTSIGDLAFDSCTSLTSITIPDSVTSVELDIRWLHQPE